MASEYIGLTPDGDIVDYDCEYSSEDSKALAIERVKLFQANPRWSRLRHLVNNDLYTKVEEAIASENFEVEIVKHLNDLYEVYLIDEKGQAICLHSSHSQIGAEDICRRYMWPYKISKQEEAVEPSQEERIKALEERVAKLEKALENYVKI